MNLVCVVCPVSPQSAELAKDAADQHVEEEEDVDLSKAMLNDPIVGVEVVISDHRGPGARRARPLPTPKRMSPAQKEQHDLTHLPFEAWCPICIACRRPDGHYRVQALADRSVQPLAGDYCFVRNNRDDTNICVPVLKL